LIALRANIRLPAPELVETTADGGVVGLEAGLLWPFPVGASCLRSLWRLHRNEPGWFVGEHMHERRYLTAPDGAGGDETLTDLAGERAAASLTRLGEAEP
jgi:hypothetical protein